MGLRGPLWLILSIGPCFPFGIESCFVAQAGLKLQGTDFTAASLSPSQMLALVADAPPPKAFWLPSTLDLWGEQRKPRSLRVIQWKEYDSEAACGTLTALVCSLSLCTTLGRACEVAMDGKSVPPTYS